MRVVYLVSQFPRVSETFIVDEIAAHIRRGLDVRVVALKRGEGAEGLSDNGALVADHVIQVRDGGGLRRRLCRQARQFLRQRFVPSPSFGHGTARTLAGKYGLPPNAVLRLAKAWSRHSLDADIVHCHFGPAGLYGAALKGLGLTTANLVTTFHGYDVTLVPQMNGKDAYGPLFDRGNLFLAISRRWRERVIRLGGSPERVHLHRLGVDVDNISFRIRQRGQEEPIRLVTIGRLVEKKGHSVTLRAVALLRDSRPELPVHLDLIGEGPLEQALRRQAAALGLSGFVTFHGGVSHHRALEVIDHGTAFVLSSLTPGNGDQEGIPVALMEAMASGLPVVSTWHSGIPELVEDGISGLLSPENDPAAVSRALERVIDQPRLSSRLARAARRQVETNFNHRSQHERLLRHYSTLMGSAAGI